MSFRLISAFVLSFGVTIAAAFLILPILRRLKAGQSIREDGPVWHKKKQGTPIMGGLFFIIGIIVTCITVGFSEIKNGQLSHLYVLLFSLIFGVIGFLDDYEKVKKKRNLGLTAKQKLALQAAAALVFVLLMRLTGSLTTTLFIPFFDISLKLPEPLYFAFAAFVIVATVNAVNITDGVDGLLTGVSIPVAVCFTAMASLWGLGALGILSAAIAGGLAGFLVFNFHPAKVFMGDTGSLFLGGTVCAIAFAMDVPLILVTLGIVYIVETLSDIIQIFYFKLTRGKRVFKMAPLHHHFEMCGWSEYKLFIVFTLISAVFAGVSFIGVMGK